MNDLIKSSVLVVDDEPEMCAVLKDVLKEAQYDVTCVLSGKEAIRIIENENFDLVITDLKMREMDGMALLSWVKNEKPDIEVIMITGYGTIDTAVEATKKGAFHFVQKPFKMKEMLLLVEKALSTKKLLAENKRLREEIEEQYGFGNILGRSKSMEQVFRLIKLVADTSSNVMIIGESGTGKELVAKAIHYNSRRSGSSFIAVNCSAIPEGLLESELFGHVKGSFTGAHVTRQGLFVEASGGTLFLDEIGDMPPGVQVKLLRVLQDRTIRPVGSNKSYSVDVRIISATHRDLKEEIKSGTFREDLYYRLSVIPIILPPLNERKEDFPILVDHFIRKYSVESGQKQKKITSKAMDALMNHKWEGNVRELENVIERTVVLTAKESIDIPDLPEYIAKKKKTQEFEFTDRLVPLQEVESEYINHVMKIAHGNKSKAAEILGINRRTLYRKEKQGFSGK
jgi:two-component system response regulator PilR (NtrC family)